jgi:isopenicillin-N N-acyltransferase like protein
MPTGFPLIEVAGDSFQMGYQHGKQARALIRRYLDWIGRLTSLPRSVLCSNALRFVPAIQRLSRPFIDEVFGLAGGAGISFGEAVLCQVRSEAAHRWEGGCTGFALRGAATATGEVLAGQNQDLGQNSKSWQSYCKSLLPMAGRAR